MPRLMEKKDWLQAVAEAGSANRAWYENVTGGAYDVSLSLPESGSYRVIFVKLDDLPQSQPAPHSPRHRNIKSKIRALRGAGRIRDNRDYKDILADALAERYEALGNIDTINIDTIIL